MLPKKPPLELSLMPTSHSGIRASASSQQPSGEIHSRRTVHLLFGHVADIPHYHVGELFIKNDAYHVVFSHLCLRTEIILEPFSGDQLDHKLKIGISDLFDYMDELNRPAMARLLIYADREKALDWLERHAQRSTSE